mgnify:CR=1 FL=1
MKISWNPLHFRKQKKTMRKIRLGIDMDHVLRDINRQIVNDYQRDIDESVDIDEVDYRDDVVSTVCKFPSKKSLDKFPYEDYPLEVFGHAGQPQRNLSRDLNLWMAELTNQEDYDVEVFLFSMKEYNLTIPSSYFFLSKFAFKVRKVVFPKTFDELASYGDVFITAYEKNASELAKRNRAVVYVQMNYNRDGERFADFVYQSFREFLDDSEKLDKIAKITDIYQNRKKRKSLWTWMLSSISSLLQTRRGRRT